MWEPTKTKKLFKKKIAHMASIATPTEVVR